MAERPSLRAAGTMLTRIWSPSVMHWIVSPTKRCPSPNPSTCMTLFRNRVFIYDHVNMRLLGWTLNQYDCVLIKRGYWTQRQPCTPRGIRARHLQTKQCHRSPANHQRPSKRQRVDHSLRRNQLCRPLDLMLLSPEPWGKEFLSLDCLVCDTLPQQSWGGGEKNREHV